MMLLCDYGKYGLILIHFIVITFAHVEEPELKLVNVIFRHGDRTPDDNGKEMYPTDPYLNYDFYPTGLGQLTNKGKMREYMLGDMLRERYNDLLGNLYTPNIVKGHSSDFSRTKMSLQLVLASLFPPVSIQIWHNDLDWQPIPTTYVKLVNDNFFLADECPSYLQEYDKVFNSPDVSAEWHKFDALISYVTKETKKNMSTPWDMYYLYHTLMAEYSMNLTLPAWTKSIFPYGPLYNATIFSYEIASYNIPLKRIYGGIIIRQMRDNMLAHVHGRNNKTKIFLYSGHESNIASVLNALNAFKPHVPAYSSAIMMELYEANRTYYVKVFHYLGIPPKIEEISPLGCETWCPLDKFLSLSNIVTPYDEEIVCDKTKTQDYADQKPDSSSYGVFYDLVDTLRNNKI